MPTTLPSNRLAQYRTTLESKLALLDIATDTYMELLAQKVQDSSLNTGEGSSRALMIRIKDMEETITILEAEVCLYSRKVSGNGDVQYMNVRRKR